MRLSRLLVLLLLAGCHSDPFQVASYGATGVLVPGAEAQLTFNSGGGAQANSPAYSPDGSLILYRFSPRYHQLGEHLIPDGRGNFVVADPNDTCVAGLPARGGSAVWSFCETGPHQTDTTNDFVTAALNLSNQLVYVEASSTSDLPIPVYMHAELWLAAPLQPLVRRVKLRQLYHESGLGISADDSSAVNWITGLSFTDATSFVALGWSRWADGSLHPYGVVTGSIGNGPVSLTRVAGTETAVYFTPASISGGVLFADGASLSVLRSNSSGQGTVVATIPSLSGRSIAGLSCVAVRCVVLTREPNARSSVWGLSLPGGTVTLLRANLRASEGIALSPASGDVVIDGGAQLFLLTGLAP